MAKLVRFGRDVLSTAEFGMQQTLQEVQGPTEVGVANLARG